MKEHIYLVDGSGFIFRAFHALPPLHRSDGTPVNAVLGFVNIMLRLIDEFRASHLLVIFDAGRRNFRHDMYPDYKANRGETPPELIPQFSLIRESCQAFGIPFLEKEGFEADDLLATYARIATAQGMQVTIVSSDKDLMQLIQPGVDMLDPIKNKAIGPNEVLEKFGVLPSQVCDVQALAGDSSDNVPGVPGIGVKTAAALIQQFGDLEGVLKNVDIIPQPKRQQMLRDHSEDARMSLALVRLDAHVPVDVPLSALKIERPSVAPLLDFLQQQEFHSLLNRIKKKMATTETLTNNTPQSFPGPSVETSAQNNPSSIKDDTPPLFSSSLFKNGFNKKQPALADAYPPAYQLHTSQELSLWLSKWLAMETQPVIGIAYQRTHDSFATLAFAVATESCWIECRDAVSAASCLHALAATQAIRVGYALKPLFVEAEKTINSMNVPLFDDVMLMAYVLNNGRMIHDLPTLIQHHLAEEAPEDSATGPKSSAQLCREAHHILLLCRKLHQKFETEGLLSVYETLDRPLMPVLAKMERQGIQVDPQILKKLSAYFGSRMETLEKEIYSQAGRAFNIASPKQLGVILFDELRLAPGKKGGKSGDYVTNAQVLEELASAGHTLPQTILQWRHYAKLKSTYTDALLTQMNPETHRVHTTFSMTTTSTGRLSSLDPNLQNIPIRTEEGRPIRQAFVAGEGHVLMSFDYSQIELRLLAHVAGIDSLIQAFQQGEDIHQRTAAEVFGVPLADVTDDLRRRAKAINFGIIYGISGYGLGRQIHVSSQEANEYIKKYFTKYPGIQAYMVNTIEKGRQQGFVATPWGRRCYLPGLQDANRVRRQFAERQAVNAPIQGGAADIMRLSMIAVDHALEERKRQEKGFGAHLLLQVHDELVFEVETSQAPTFCHLIQPIMEQVVALSVPLKVDVSWGPSWVGGNPPIQS